MVAPRGDVAGAVSIDAARPPYGPGAAVPDSGSLMLMKGSAAILLTVAAMTCAAPRPESPRDPGPQPAALDDYRPESTVAGTIVVAGGDTLHDILSSWSEE